MAQLGQDPDISKVVLLGSRTRGGAREDSNLDLLLIVAGSLTPERVKRLWRRMHHLRLPLLPMGRVPLACTRPLPRRRGATRCHLSRMPPGMDATQNSGRKLGPPKKWHMD